MSDPDHTLRLFPTDYVRLAKLKVVAQVESAMGESETGSLAELQNELARLEEALNELQDELSS